MSQHLHPLLLFLFHFNIRVPNTIFLESRKIFEPRTLPFNKQGSMDDFSDDEKADKFSTLSKSAIKCFYASQFARPPSSHHSSPSSSRFGSVNSSLFGSGSTSRFGSLSFASASTDTDTVTHQHNLARLRWMRAIELVIEHIRDKKNDKKDALGSYSSDFTPKGIVSLLSISTEDFGDDRFAFDVNHANEYRERNKNNNSPLPPVQFNSPKSVGTNQL